MLPLAHDFTDETVLVFGGGSVGARKARHFASEAHVVVVSPAFVDADFGESEQVRAVPDPDDVDEWVGRFDPVLVVAATDDAAVNDAAATAARDHGALVNRADRSAAGRDASSGASRAASDGAASDESEARNASSGTSSDDPADSSGGRAFDDVAVPATVRDDPVVVSVSTGGTSPALARVLRQRVEEQVEGADAMAELTGDLRERLREAEVDPDRRREAVRAVVRSSHVWTGLRSGDSNVEQITEDLVAEVLEDP